MSLGMQIMLGSAVLGACVVVHVGILGAGIAGLSALGAMGPWEFSTIRWISFVLAGAFVVLLGHSAQVWIWALTLRWLGALDDLSDAIYFALVTTTTLGYGDITLQPRHRVFGAIAAVAGLITFGLSTAFVIGIVSQLVGTTA